MSKAIKDKYKHLRTYYVKLKKQADKSRTSGAGTDQIIEPTWEHYKDLGFLDDTLVVRSTTSSLPQPSTQETEIPQSREPSSSTISTREPNSSAVAATESALPESDVDASMMGPSTSGSTPAPLLPPTSQRKRQRRSQTTHPLVTRALESAMANLEKAVSIQEGDHIDHFAKSVASQLRDIHDKEQQSLCMLEIMQIIHRFKYAPRQEQDSSRPVYSDL